MIVKFLESFLMFELMFYGLILLAAQFVLVNWRRSRHFARLLFVLAWRKRHRVQLFQNALSHYQCHFVSKQSAKQFIKSRHLKHTLSAFKYYVYLLTMYDQRPLTCAQLVSLAVQMQLANRQFHQVTD